MKREILFRGKVTKVPQYMQDKNRMAVGDWVRRMQNNEMFDMRRK